MTEVALERLISGGADWRSLVRDMAAAHPQASPLSLIFALTAAGSAIETMYTDSSPTAQTALRAYRLAALLGTDLHAAHLARYPVPDLAALMRYWQDHDDYFLTL